MQDVRYAIRSLSRSPGYTLVALLTLALGIGANTAIFSVIEGVLLRPLPYPDSDRVVRIWERGNSGGRMDFSWLSYRDVATTSTTLDAAAAMRPWTMTLVGGSEPVRVAGTLISNGFWDVFRLSPVAGRLTRVEEHVEGAAPVVVLGEGLAVRMFGSAEAAVDQPLTAVGVEARVVGVLPSAFNYPLDAQVWVPLELFGENTSRTSHNEDVVGRMAAGVDLDVAFQEVDGLVARANENLPDDPDYLPVGVHMESLLDSEVGGARRSLFILWGAAGFVLLVACTNLASTVLARGTIRARELSVRASLGATRGRIVRQLMTESLVLTTAGGVAGVGIAWATLAVLRPLGAGSLPRLAEVGVSPTVLGFAAVVAIGTTLLFGLLPALRLAPDGLAQALRSGTRHTRGNRRVWGTLIAAEVAMALVLLIGSGLMMRSFARITAQDPGVDTEDVTMVTVSLNGPEYSEPAAYARFWDDVLPDLAAIPGVESAGIMTSRPVQGFVPTGRISLDQPENYINAPAYIASSPEAFAALDIPLVRGELFTREDGPETPHTVVVNEAFVREFSPDQEVLGRRVTGGGMDRFYISDPPVFATIVGVVKDVKYRSLTDTARASIYWNYRQRPGRLSSAALFLEEGDQAGPELIAAVRARLHRTDPDLALEFARLSDQVGETLRARRFILMVLAVFSGMALSLSAIGIYGVVSYTTARRTREVGIRMALGAHSSTVRGMVVRTALQPVAIGIMVGVALSMGLSGLLETLLFDIQPLDLMTFTLVPLILGAVGVGASWIPAIRSSRVSPTVAMRIE